MTLTYTPKDYKLHLLYSYYVISGRWKYYRLFMGVFCIINGTLLLNLNADDKLSLELGAISLVYGIYYLLKPIIVMLVKKYKEETISLEFNGNELFVHDRIGNATLNLQEFPLQANRRYYFIKLQTGQKLFFPKYKLSPEQQFDFESRIISKANLRQKRR